MITSQYSFIYFSEYLYKNIHHSAKAAAEPSEPVYISLIKITQKHNVFIMFHLKTRSMFNVASRCAVSDVQFTNHQILQK